MTKKEKRGGPGQVGRNPRILRRNKSWRGEFWEGVEDMPFSQEKAGKTRRRGHYDSSEGAVGNGENARGGLTQLAFIGSRNEGRGGRVGGGPKGGERSLWV